MHSFSKLATLGTPRPVCGARRPADGASQRRVGHDTALAIDPREELVFFQSRNEFLRRRSSGRMERFDFGPLSFSLVGFHSTAL